MWVYNIIDLVSQFKDEVLVRNCQDLIFFGGEGKSSEGVLCLKNIFRIHTYYHYVCILLYLCYRNSEIWKT
jgi:hypothetical protein